MNCWSKAPSSYLLLPSFNFEPVPNRRALQVRRPRGRISVIAHRGGRHDAPKNTLAAIREAAKNAATGVELDIEFPADGVPVLMHDGTVDRTTDGTGRLSDFTIADVRKLNPAANHRLKNDFPGEKIPTPKEAIVECLDHNLTAYFDGKSHAAMAAGALKHTSVEFPKLCNISIVCSFMPEVIYKVRQADRNVVKALIQDLGALAILEMGNDASILFGSILYMLLDILLDWSLYNILWHLCGISAFLTQKDFVSRAYLKRWSAKGIHVLGWAVNTHEDKKF